jgi:hypothetical protein
VGGGGGDLPALLNEIEQKTAVFLREARRHGHGTGDEAAVVKEIRMKLETIFQLPVMASRFPWIATKGKKTVPEYLQENIKNTTWLWHTLLGWLFVHNLGELVGPENFPEQSRKWIDEWRLDKIIAGRLLDSGLDEGSSRRLADSIKILTRHQLWFEMDGPRLVSARGVLDSLLSDADVRKFIQVNDHDGVLWFNKESFEELLFWLMLVAFMEIGSRPLHSSAQVLKEIEECHGLIQKIQEAETKSEYQVEKILMALRGD